MAVIDGGDLVYLNALTDDAPDLYALFADLVLTGTPTVLAVEDQRMRPAERNPAAIGSLLRTTGKLEGVLAAKYPNTSITYIDPVRWQHGLCPGGLGKTYNARKRKGASLARKLYPHPPRRITNPLADAVLIAHYSYHALRP